MPSIKARIKKRIDMTIKDLKSDLYFSPYLGFIRIVDEFSYRLHFTSIAERAHQRKNDYINNYIKKIINPVIEKYKNIDLSNKDYCENDSLLPPVWVCWWTGEDSAPELVKQCIKSIRKNAGEHPVHIITENNYIQYLDIPDYIIDKVKNGNMCIAHFTDYLRSSLIAQHGGIWIDATIFLTAKLPDYCFNTDFFTLKSEMTKSRYLSNLQWTTFLLSGRKGAIFFSFLKESFEAYWNRVDRAIDYLFFDNLFYLAYNNISSIKFQMDAVPISNIHRDDLQAAMNDAIPAEKFNEVIKNDTVFYKLSWRETYSRQTADGKSTVYDYFLKMKI